MSINKKITDRVDDLLVISGCTSLFEGNSKVYAFVGSPMPFEKRLAISGINRGTTTLITVPDHGLDNNQDVTIFGIPTESSINGYQGPITVVDSDTILVPVDSSSDPAYQGGGVLSFVVSKVNQFDDISHSTLLKTMVGLQRVRRKDVYHALFRKDWEPRRYNIGEYVNVGMDTFVCIDTPADGSPSVEQPDVEWSSITEMSDGYKWKLVYSPSAHEITMARGFDNNLVPIGRIFSYGPPHTNRWKSKFETVEGSITSIVMTDGGSGYNASNIDDIKVVINGDGQGAKAKISGITGTSITKIDIVDGGHGYSWATVSIFDSSFNGFGARAEAVVSPLRGVGYDPIHELKPEWIIVDASIGAGECSEVIPTNIPIRTFGLILEPTVNGYPITEECVVIGDRIKIRDQHGSIAPGDMVIGQSSGHKAVVIGVDNNYVTVNSATGQFFSGEVIISPSGDATVVDYYPSEYNSLWGTIIYYAATEGFIRVKEQYESLLLAVKVV